eukprot:1200819-Alexandrium_andersonii.AAC.1
MAELRDKLEKLGFTKEAQSVDQARAEAEAVSAQKPSQQLQQLQEVHNQLAQLGMHDQAKAVKVRIDTELAS